MLVPPLRFASLPACALAALLAAAPAFAMPAPEADPATAARAARHMVALAATPLVTSHADAVEGESGADGTVQATTHSGLLGRLQVMDIPSVVLLFATGVVLLGFARDRRRERG